MNIKEFISQRLKLTIEKIDCKTDDFEFVLFFELGVGKQSLSTKEDIANWWSLPYSVNRRLSLTDVIDKIHFFDSIAPLWIKASIINEQLIGLELSQKLRKRKDILHHHKDSDLAPFIIKEPYLDFTDNIEREGLLEHLVLMLQSDSKLERYFAQNPPKVEEIIKFIKRNFDNYFIYFPNNYSHQEKEDENYSNLIIKKNNDDFFHLTDREDNIFKKSSNLNEIIITYIEQELNYKIGQITIVK